MEMNHNCMKLQQSPDEKGYMLTPQRQVVLDVILNNKGNPLGYEEIYEMVKENHPEIGMAAVYRALPLLEKMGFLSSVHIQDGCERYQLN